MFDIKKIIQAALEEDIGPGDVTTIATVPSDRHGKAEFLAKEDFVLAGLHVARETFSILDPQVRFHCLAKDGERVGKGESFAGLEGRARSLLQGERVALNFLQRMSGIATLTRSFVEAIKGTSAAIVDTRKTTPGLRILEKYAVQAGGGA